MHEVTHNEEPTKKSERKIIDKPTKSAFGGLMKERRFLLRGCIDPLSTLEAYKKRLYHILMFILEYMY